jgi:hypothetical protein
LLTACGVESGAVAQPDDPGNAGGSTASGGSGAGGGSGGIDLGTGGGAGAQATSETCDGLDDDGDGSVDEGCSCAAGTEQACYLGDPTKAGVGACVMGVQQCDNEELGGWGACTGSGQPATSEQCNNAIDDDCDGALDTADPECENCNQQIQLTLNGDCVTASCPPEAPYPVGCNINFVGDTPVGCVAHTSGSPVVFMKEGVVCDAGYLTGTLECSCTSGPALDASNCPINKQQTYYPADSSQCP